MGTEIKTRGSRVVMVLPAVLYLVAVVLSILSQLPDLRQTQLGTAFKFTWLLPLGFILARSPRSLYSSRLKIVYAAAFMFFTYCGLMELLTDRSYIGSDFNNVLIALVVGSVSMAVWRQYGSQRFLNGLVMLVFATTAVVGFVIYRDYLSGFSFARPHDIYTSKNSMAQILLNSLLLMFAFRPRNRWALLLPVVVALFLVAEIFMLKSRAVMVGLVIMGVYLTVIYRNKYVMSGVVVAVIGIVVWTLCNVDMSRYFFDNVLLANRDMYNMESLSSERSTKVGAILSQIPGNFLTGLGNFYLDCFPVAILGQYGLIGAAPVYVIVAMTGVVAWRYSRERTPVTAVALMLYIALMINSIFEAQAPFGPGVKCFALWMFMGFAMAEHREHRLFKM